MMSTVPVATGVPQLSSNSAASAKIYLDFNGADSTVYKLTTVPTAPAYDVDADVTTFSDKEQANIREIWSRVSEQFSPFNVDVTTVDPGAFADRGALRVVIGGSADAAYLSPITAERESFYDSDPNTVYVFENQFAMTDLRGIALQTGRAVGRAFGLHDQIATEGKMADGINEGNAAMVPLMGYNMTAQRGLWWNGYYMIAETTSGSEDNMAIIAGTNNGFGYRADDHGGSISTATAMNGTISGIIEKTTDTDYISFTTSGGSVTINGNPAQYGAMLDLKLELLNSSGNLLASADGTALSASLTTSLTAGTYYVKVSGHGMIDCYDNENRLQGQAADVGQYSLTVTGGTTPAPTAPTAPSGATASAVSTSQINLSWTDASSNETGFEIDRATNSSFTGATTATVGAGVTSYSASGLAAGTTYYFRVRATNTAGDSANSNVASATTTTAVTLPVAPSGLTASGVSTSQINLAWGDNSSNETGFEIDRATDSAFTSGLSTVTVGAGVTSYSASGLAAGTTYYFRVRATNTAGDSANTATASAATQAAAPVPTAPAAASSLVATTASASQVNLVWNDNSSNETGFEIDRATNSTFTSGLATMNVGADVESYGMAGLASGTTYYFRVRATNAVGDSANTAVVNATTSTLATVPAAASGLTATTASSSQINLAWVDNSGNETGFKIERSTSSSFTTVTTVTVGANVRTYSATGLAAGTTYYFRVKATNAVGDATASNAASATTSTVAPVVSVPSTPTGLRKNRTGKKTTISWTDTSSNETGFRLQYSTDGGTTWVSMATLGANQTSYQTSLKNADQWRYRVQSYNASGNSAWAVL